MKGSPIVSAIVVTVAAALCISLAVWAVLPGATSSVELSPHTPLSAEEAAVVEAKYSPSLIFSVGERTFPVAVEHFIAHCQLTSPVGTVLLHLIAEDLAGTNLGSCALDHTGGSASDAGAISVYESEGADEHIVVYVHSSETDGKVIIQYWLFYVFNQGTYNSHEGDWEMIEVVLERESLSPSTLALSRHHTGSRIAWSALEETDLNGTHPVVLVSLGSHANYCPSRAGRDAGDVADGGGRSIRPDEYEAVSIGRAGDDSPARPWLLFPGIWGERTSMGGMLGTDGPPGPMFREGGQMWAGLRWGW
jgi:hypothetical protein